MKNDLWNASDWSPICRKNILAPPCEMLHEGWYFFHFVQPLTSACLDSESASIISFGKFVEEYLPLTRAEQRHLKRTFTEPGNIGEGYRPFLDKLKHALQFDREK